MTNTDEQQSKVNRFWPLFVTLSALVFAVVAGCSRQANSSDNAYPSSRYEGTQLDQPAPNFQLIDQNGTNVALSDFRGRVVILAFLDPKCTDTCPLTALHFRLTSEALGKDATKVVFLAVNVNAKANSTADVAAVTEKWGVASMAAWHFLTGGPDDLEAVWKAYDIFAGGEKPNKPEEVQHTPGVYIIDQTGEERWYISPWFEGAPPLSEQLVKHVRKLLHGRR